MLKSSPTPFAFCMDAQKSTRCHACYFTLFLTLLLWDSCEDADDMRLGESVDIGFDFTLLTLPWR